MSNTFKVLKVKADYGGLNQLRNSEELTEIVERKVQEIVNEAGEGFESAVDHMGTRVVGRVRVASKEAYKRTLKDNVLLKALRGAKE